MKFFDGVGHVTATTGTGTITLGAAIDSSYFTFAEQGAVSTDQVYYRIDEDGDVEIGIGTLGASAGTLTRDTVLKSRIGGTAGTTKMTLAGSAEVLCVDVSENIANIGLGTTGIFIKADAGAVAFTKTAAGTADVKAGTLIEVDGKIFSFVSATAITMPTLTSGTDYAIWIKPDGTVEATADHVSPPVAASRKIGGFHYAPGGNATGTSGGDTTPAINPYSFWDLKFRPACPDPRGMVLVAGRFWVDIYPLGVNHHTDGTSKYNVTIADGASPPKIPAAFGGNGSSAYGSLTWWEASEVMQSHGKDLLSYAEFAAAMYGTTEATSGGTDPVSTILRAAYTSRWGVMLSTGNLWVWAREFGGPYGTAAYTANTNGRGSTYNLSNAAILGGSWSAAADSGSRASAWHNAPAHSGSSIGARGRSDLVCHV